jgi:glutamyl-tRNA synthetase
VRLRVPDEGVTVVKDAIRGEARFEHIHLDDPVIARGDGSVLYNFAAAIDDLDAAITHVVRGEDHLSNTPKQLLVLEAAREASLFDGPLAPELPVYAHLPLLYGPDGKKLSKRHGAASVQELRAAGYLPEAIRNYLALLGWGAGDDATVLSTRELVERFTLERVSRNPARFDEAKLSWLNGVYIRALPSGELSSRLEQFLGRDGLGREETLSQHPATLLRAAEISQEKIHTLADFWPLAGFLFEEPEPDPAASERWLDSEGLELLHQARGELAGVERFDDADEIKKTLESLVKRARVKPGKVYQPLRVAISGSTVSPGIFESVAALGKDETLRRIDVALDHPE